MGSNSLTSLLTRSAIIVVAPFETKIVL